MKKNFYFLFLFFLQLSNLYAEEIITVNANTDISGICKQVGQTNGSTTYMFSNSLGAGRISDIGGVQFYSTYDISYLAFNYSIPTEAVINSVKLSFGTTDFYVNGSSASINYGTNRTINIKNIAFPSSANLSSIWNTIHNQQNLTTVSYSEGYPSNISIQNNELKNSVNNNKNGLYLWFVHNNLSSILKKE